ncbi:MAG: glucosamine-6-phosphate deaminase, partial [Phycisphaerales bacterium]
MNKLVFVTKQEMGTAAAQAAAEGIRQAIAEKGQANLILATGASQFEMLEALTAASGIDWSKVIMFHLDEYIGLGPDHPASFRKYLKERFVDRVGPLQAAHFVDGDTTDPAAECTRLGDLIRNHPIDVACIGIGENGHLAFNDPPADFNTDEPYLVVDLDERCRKQQLGEGWFPTLDDVPRRAISMSIRQILRSERLIVTVPDERKATAVAGALTGPVTPDCPASILQEHGNCSLFLDEPAASQLPADS